MELQVIKPKILLLYTSSAREREIGEIRRTKKDRLRLLEQYLLWSKAEERNLEKEDIHLLQLF